MLPSLPGAVLDHQSRTSLDRAARLLGLSLDAREDLASDGPRAHAFLAAVADGDVAAAARMAGLDAPPNLLLRLAAVPPSPAARARPRLSRVAGSAMARPPRPEPTISTF